MPKPSCIVIGASHAGVNFAFNLRKEGWEGEILLIDADSSIPYHRPPLSKAFLVDGELDNYFLRPLETYKNSEITLILGERVESISRDSKTISLSSGREISYDKLVIATGARPFIPPIRGIEKAPNLYALRTASDALQIKDAVARSVNKRVVLIGGGYIGLETAASLKKLGAEVVVIEKEERVLARVTAPIMSQFFSDLHKTKEVDIHTGKTVSAIEKAEDGYHVVCLDGSVFDADVIVIGVGISVNSELAEAVGLTIENGIKVNSFAQTSDPAIYAIGDCTYHYNPHYKKFVRLESVQNAIDQGKVAAANICGREIAYNSIPWFWSDQFDIKLQMVGLQEGYNEVLVRKEATETTCFSVWYFKDDELLAVDAVNHPKAYVLGTRLISAKQKINKTKLVDSSIPMKPTSFL